MDHETTFTITLRDRDFLLTKSQIEFDSPNYFTASFLGDFRESQTRHLKLSRDPDLFLIILDYLCGYQILPLSERAIPTRMSPEHALANLKVDALFYQLGGLVEQCDGLIAPGGATSKLEKPYLLIGAEYTFSGIGSWTFQDQIDGALKSKPWSTRIIAERLTQEPLNMATTPEANTGFVGLHLVAIIEQFAREVSRTEPRLVGWYHSTDMLPEPDMLYFQIMVVLEV